MAAAHDVIQMLHEDARLAGKPDPEAAAIRLGLVLRPVLGAKYSFDGHTITYDAEQPLPRQREQIARAVVVHLLQQRGLRREPRMSCGAAARQLFGLD